MCGITGFLKLSPGLSGAPLEEERKVLASMNRTLVHRGPDGEGSLIDPPAYLAMRRLNIIDLISGSQPIFNETKTVAVIFNGEIYNYLELRQTLTSRGHHFQTQSDTEVLVHLYEEEGENFPKKLRGMYAFALWDASRRRLILGRDPFGIKPLYWGIFQGYLLFGSEIKAIAKHPKAQLKIFPQAVDDFLTLMYIPAPYTIYEGLWKLEPGHLLVCEPGGACRKVEFWKGLPSASNGKNPNFPSLKKTLERLDEKISECVKIGLRSDVPLGVFLSSGLDSSAVAYYAKKHKADLRTFTVFFREKSFSEKEGARAIAKALGTEHSEILMEVPSDIARFVCKVFECFDEPFGDISALPTYLLCQAAREHVTVSLSGDGGDELFGGYPTFSATQIFRYMLFLPKVLRKRLFPSLALQLPTHMNRVSLDYKFKRFFTQAAGHDDWREVHFAWRGAFSWPEREEVYKAEFFKSVSGRKPYDSVTPYFNRVSGAPFLDQLLYADRMSYLADEFLVKMDRMSMAHSLEVRPPLLDWELAEESFLVSPSYKIRGLQTKWILRRLMEGKIPRSILKLPKKGFTPPLALWFKQAPFKDFVRDVVNSKTFLDLNIIEDSCLDRLLEEHSQGFVDHTRRLWVILGLALFAERHDKIRG